MDKPSEPDETLELPSSPNALDFGLAVAFAAPRSSFPATQRPILLREVKSESSHIVKPITDSMPQPHLRGDRYQLHGEIARGGMGSVLRGRDVDLGRELAIKVLLSKYVNSPEAARRFLEEAQIGGQLQHPGVVPVYDIGCFGEQPFFTMKLVKGQTLAALLLQRENAEADRPRLLAIALQVAQTLAYAHAKGVIHRDLKPANIMVGAFGEVQVMDWGLAKVLPEGGVSDELRAGFMHQQAEDKSIIRTLRAGTATGSSSTTASAGFETEIGSLLGTPAYMPPEQANGNVGLLDRRCDVFGLGALLCEILTGKPPYQGRSSEEVRRMAANADLASAHARLDASGAETELITLTKTCLAPEASNRPQDAKQVAEALTKYLDGVQERLRQAELSEAEARATAIEEAKRRRVTLALAVTVLLAVSLGGGGWLWTQRQQSARHAQLTRDVNIAIGQAAILREQAKIALKDSAPLFAQARGQVSRALALVESGPVDKQLLIQVRQLQTQLDEEELDYRLVAALDESRLAQAETMTGDRSGRFAEERAIPLFREALRAYGMAAGAVDAQVAAERIRSRPEAVQNALLAALDEWVELATNPQLGVNEPNQRWLEVVLDLAEPKDGWLGKFRAARTASVKAAGSKDDLITGTPLSLSADHEESSPGPPVAVGKAALIELAEAIEVHAVPAHILTRLAKRMTWHSILIKHRSDGSIAKGWGELVWPAQAVELLRKTQRQYPSDFWVNHELGSALQSLEPPQTQEALRYLSAAVALRPDSPRNHLTLGHALMSLGHLDDATCSFSKAIELAPAFAAAHFSLGEVLRKRGLKDEAIANWRRASELNQDFVGFHKRLALAQYARRSAEGVVAQYRHAIEVDPMDAEAHFELAHFLHQGGRLEEAIESFQSGLEVFPGETNAKETLAALERMVALQDKLIAFQNGKYSPLDNAERLELGLLAYHRKLYYTGAKLFAMALAEDPQLANDQKQQQRYNAACLAALAANAQGEDTATLDDSKKARLRSKALEWLHAELALNRNRLKESEQSVKDEVYHTLQHWQVDPDLAGIRTPQALALLSEKERPAFADLWSQVAELLSQESRP